MRGAANSLDYLGLRGRPDTPFPKNGWGNTIKASCVEGESVPRGEARWMQAGQAQPFYSEA